MADTPKPTERQARTPLPREDGDEKKPPFKTPRMRILLIVAALLAINYILVGAVRARPGRAGPRPVQPDVPRAGARRQRRAHLDHRARRSTASSRRSSSTSDAEPNKAFETEIPIFANERRALQAARGQEASTIEAEPINQSRGFLASLILGFGPVILLIGLFVYFARRAGGGGR